MIPHFGMFANPADKAIARQAVTGDYTAAFDSLIAEAETTKKRNAERYRQAA